MKELNRNEELLGRKRELPELVMNRARAAGEAGEIWLDSLDDLITTLENEWEITVGEALSGGTHAFVARAKGYDGKDYVLKIEMPDSLGSGGFENNIIALKLAEGRGYAHIYNYDIHRRAYLIESLGEPLSKFDYTVNKQIELICHALIKSWESPVRAEDFSEDVEATAWFREFIGDNWKALNYPCSPKVINKVFEFLDSRRINVDSDNFVLVHGDAHSNNTLEDLSNPGTFKLVDPDGLYYEKASDLGVIMREWQEDYEDNPVEKGLARCELLSNLTGVPQKGIWEWGFIQSVSTGFVLLHIGQEDFGRKMLKTAEAWAEI